jgi:peptidyl-prolyl cis-trans isomerase B (cyclophilin B)
VASSKDRQRALARAKAERQSAKRAVLAARNRRIKAASTAFLTLAVVGLGVSWRAGAFDKPKQAPAQCNWAANPDTSADLTDVGKPKTRGLPNSGTRSMTVALTQGTITIQMDLSKSTCGAASFDYLAGKKFFDNTKCHKLITSVTYALQCGDPKGTGKGGPSYVFADENLPENTAAASASASAGASSTSSASTAASATAAGSPSPTTAPSASTSASAAASAAASASPSASASTYVYKKGTVALMNTGTNTNGSQFLIFYQDSPAVSTAYSILGTVTAGLEIIENIAKAGVGTDGASPKDEVKISSLTVGAVVLPSASAATSGSVAASPAAGSSAATSSATAATSASSGAAASPAASSSTKP